MSPDAPINLLLAGLEAEDAERRELAEHDKALAPFTIRG